MTKAFETYEQVAIFLLNEFAGHLGLERVEGKQKVPGFTSGTIWRLDGKGVREGDQPFMIVECRCYRNSKPSQEDLGALAYRIQATGAAGGIIVTPLGIQKGAAKVAGAAGIVSVQLDPHSTTSDYVLQFLNNVMIGASVNFTTAVQIESSSEVSRPCSKCGAQFLATSTEQICPKCTI
jgi:Zn finger protein HypA/HybF involved in hydrogenase expression